MKKIKSFYPHIWLKQLFFFLLLAAALLLSLQLLFNLFVERQFQRYLSGREEALNSRITGSVLDYYRYYGSWSGVQMTLRHLAMGTDTYLLLTGPEGEPLADSAARHGHHGAAASKPARRLLPAKGDGYWIYLDLDGLPVGRLYIEHPRRVMSGVWQDQDLIFRRALSGSLIWAGLLAAAAALLLSIIFSRRLSRPLEEMSRAVDQVARGDYSSRLPVYDSRELNNLSANLNRMTVHLSELEQLRRRSTADLSHELRTPLATLRSHIEGIKDGVLEADPETLNVLSEEILHLGRVVSDLDELARAESRRGHEPRREQVELNSFLAEKVASFKPLCAQKEQQLELSLPEQPLLVRIDPAALGKMVGNLLANACRYTGTGGKITVTLSGAKDPGPEAVSPLGADYHSHSLCPRLHDYVQITVSDNGPGMDPKQLPYIFERFFRIDPSRERSPERGGTGIGLALVKELVRAAGGAVFVQSRPGRGTTFHLYLLKWKHGGGSKAPG